MSMVRLDDMDDYERLPVTEWNIKQPVGEEQRENAIQTGKHMEIINIYLI